MKQNRLLVWLTVLGLLVTLAACGKTPAGKQPSGTTTTATPDTPDEPALNPTFEAMPQKSQYMAEVYRVGDTAALTAFITPGMDSMLTELVSYDLATDAVLGELDLGERRLSIFPLEDGFAVLDADAKTYTVYNTACKEQSSVTLTFDGVIGDANQNGDNLLLSDMRSGTYHIYHLSTNTVTLVNHTMSAVMASCVGNHKDGFVVQSYEDGLLIISPDGTVQSVRKVSDGIQVAGTAYVGGVAADYTLFHSLAGGESMMIPVRGDAEMFLCADGHRFLSVSDGEEHSVLHYYDMNRRTVIDYDATGYVSDAVLFGDGVLAAVHDDFVAPVTLIYVDFSDFPAEDMHASDYDADAVAGRRPLPQVSGVAAELKETYGVTVIGDVDFFDLSVFGYTATPTTADKITELLDDVEDVLAFFPEGIFKEISEKTPVVIVLCEELGNGAGGINTAMDGYNVSYVCATGNDAYIENTIAHELAHAIEQ